ncbi:MAG: DUF5685 family protein [[Clostridium] leptum]
MFGYIRPNKPELLVKEYDLYKSAYCGLCKRMGKDYGRLSRLALSYDGTFLAMLSMALGMIARALKRDDVWQTRQNDALTVLATRKAMPMLARFRF